MTLAQLLHQADEWGCDRLDAECLLAHVINRPRSYCYAHPEAPMDPYQQQQWRALVQRRLQGEPLAYLKGKQAFWSFDLRVTSDVLIPRPDTECLVEAALHYADQQSPLRIMDLGTGSGAIALALATECNHWAVHASDRCPKALAVANHNAQRLGLAVTFHRSHWWRDIQLKPSFDMVVSNPPYIDPTDIHLPALRFEPTHALVAQEKGYRDLAQLITETPPHLTTNGWLLLEHGYQQASQVRQLMIKASYRSVITLRDLSQQERVTLGQCPLLAKR